MDPTYPSNPHSLFALPPYSKLDHGLSSCHPHGLHPHAMTAISIADVSVKPSTNVWYPDLGATHHLTADQTLIQEPCEKFSAGQIYMGNGIGIKASGSLRPYNKHKLEFRSSECTFVGYSTSHKGYKCLSKEGKFFISKDVIFNEYAFPYASSTNTGSASKSPPPCPPATYVFPITSESVMPVNHSPPVTPISPDVPIIPSDPHSHNISPVVPIISSDRLFPIHVSSGISPLSPSTSLDSGSPGVVSSNSPSSPPVVFESQSIHPMQTRFKSGISKRIVPRSFLTHVEPSSATITLTISIWKDVMTAEYDALMKLCTWFLTSLPPGKQVIGCKWKLDVNNAFLNGGLTKEVYMQQHLGFEHSDKNLVCKLHKAFYGLKQAPRQWFDKLKHTLVTFGFSISRCDNSLFILHTSTYKIYVLVYVDDIMVTGSSLVQVKNVIYQLSSAFALKQLGTLDYFLGIEASDCDDIKSTSGACLFLGNNLITWWSKKQITISRSSTEAEYMSLALIAQEFQWVQSLLQELKFSDTAPLLLCDSLNTVALAHNHVLHQRTKHVELDLFFVRDKVQSKSLLVKQIPASFQTTNILTKPLSSSRFSYLRNKL
ncbi:PREDICTED: uncharacterized protein LOC109363515 [Lupinus angustifolius]|uniref:uncharacterized protein LOC109363515 n=1 Tax=Lupinus angustifolius TaxID=3871 RepID=UPI00092EB947|nr:PREDICTED: uncharacterized protein LOC109363515 [Lupinus angustifolius]